jgi:hypothetical protein
MLSSSGAWDPYKGALYCQSQTQVLFVDMAQHAHCSLCTVRQDVAQAAFQVRHSTLKQRAAQTTQRWTTKWRWEAFAPTRPSLPKWTRIPAVCAQGHPGHQQYAAKLRCCQWQETRQATAPAARRDLVHTQADEALCDAQGR